MSRMPSIKHVFSTEASDGELPIKPDSEESGDKTELTNVDPTVPTRDLVEKAKRAGNIRSTQMVPVTGGSNTNTATVNVSPPTRKRKAQEIDPEISCSNDLSLVSSVHIK